MTVQERGNGPEFNAREIQLDPHLPSTSLVDAGDRARSKLSFRQKAAHRAKVIWNFMILTFCLTVIGVGGVLYKKISEAPRMYQVDNRPCKYVNEPLGITLTGTRSYSYYQHELFGFQWRDSSEVTAKTILDVRGQEMTVIGVGTGDWWYTYIGGSEQGVEILKPADLYQFVIGKKAVAVPYNTFCR